MVAFPVVAREGTEGLLRSRGAASVLPAWRMECAGGRTRAHSRRPDRKPGLSAAREIDLDAPYVRGAPAVGGDPRLIPEAPPSAPDGNRPLDPTLGSAFGPAMPDSQGGRKDQPGPRRRASPDSMKIVSAWGWSRWQACQRPTPGRRSR